MVDMKSELNANIAFLQSIPLFEDVDAKFLMPIACNMNIRMYSFGEYIVKEGQIPDGLYLMKKGQAKIATMRIAKRDIKNIEQINKKLGDKKRIKDKSNPLFNDFDTDNTLLNVRE